MPRWSVQDIPAPPFWQHPVVSLVFQNFQNRFGCGLPTKLPHGPRKDPFALLLDVGATLEARAQDLVGFAVMGAAYARIVSANPRPRVALLSNGTEPGRGSRSHRAHHLLSKQGEFIGNVEGNHIPMGTADVIVSPILGNGYSKPWKASVSGFGSGGMPIP